MLTEKQQRANAQNAQQSTGPRSDAGKAASARNSLKHGLTAQKYLLEHEDKEALDALYDDLCSTKQPVGAFEEMLVSKIAMGMFRFQRSLSTERELFEVSPPFDLFTEQGRAIRTLAQYETMNRKTIRHLEEMLVKAQADRQARAAVVEPAGKSSGPAAANSG